MPLVRFPLENESREKKGKKEEEEREKEEDEDEGKGCFFVIFTFPFFVCSSRVSRRARGFIFTTERTLYDDLIYEEY